MFQGYKRARVLLVSETPYKPHGETGAPRPPTRPPPVGPRQARVATRSHPRAGPCPPSRHRHIRCASIKPPRVPGRARTAPPHPRKKIASPCGVAAAQSPPRRPGRRLSRSDGPTRSDRALVRSYARPSPSPHPPSLPQPRSIFFWCPSRPGFRSTTKRRQGGNDVDFKSVRMICTYDIHRRSVYGTTRYDSTVQLYRRQRLSL